VRCGSLTSDDVTSQCVDVRDWCDGSADCDDASDEKLCNTGRKVIRSKVNTCSSKLYIFILAVRCGMSSRRICLLDFLLHFLVCVVILNKYE